MSQAPPTRAHAQQTSPPVAADVTLLSRSLHLQEVFKSRYTSLMGTLILHEHATLLESRVLVTFQDQLKFMCNLLGGVFLANHPLITSGTAVSHLCGGGKVLHNQSIRPKVYHTVWFSGLKVVAAAAAKSLQSCPTLCDPIDIDGSPPGFPVPGILQERTLEWVAIPSPMHEREK